VHRKKKERYITQPVRANLTGHMKRAVQKWSLTFNPRCRWRYWGEGGENEKTERGKPAAENPETRAGISTETLWFEPKRQKDLGTHEGTNVSQLPNGVRVFKGSIRAELKAKEVVKPWLATKREHTKTEEDWGGRRGGEVGCFPNPPIIDLFGGGCSNKQKTDHPRPPHPGFPLVGFIVFWGVLVFWCGFPWSRWV